MEKLLQVSQFLSPIISVGVGIIIYFSTRADKQNRDKAKAESERVTECFRECDIIKDSVHKLRSEVSDKLSNCNRDCERKRSELKQDVRSECRLRHRED